MTAGIFTASAEWSLSIPGTGDPPPGAEDTSALYVAQSATSFLHQPRCVLQSPRPRPPSPGPGTANVGMTPPLDPTVGPHRHRPQQRPGHRDIRNPRHLTTELPPGAANAEFLSSRHFQVHLYSCSFEIVDSGHNIGRNILLSYQMRARPSVYVTMYTTSRCPLPSAHTILSCSCPAPRTATAGSVRSRHSARTHLRMLCWVECCDLHCLMLSVVTYIVSC